MRFLTATGIIYTCVAGLITDVTEKSAQNQVLEGNPLLNSFPISITYDVPDSYTTTVFIAIWCSNKKNSFMTKITPYHVQNRTSASKQIQVFASRF